MPITQTQPTTPRLQTYQTTLLTRPLHPEMFDIMGSRTIERGGYRLSAWVLQGSHILSFASGTGNAIEAVTDTPGMIPDAAAIDSFYCAGDRDAEHQIPNTRIRYMTAAQTEQLPEHIFEDTYNELDELARDQRAIVHRWNCVDGQNLSIVDIQDYAREVHAQGYHMIAAERLVLRTQTIFEIS